MSSLNQKYLPLVARLWLGTIFVVFGLNGFFSFMPIPEMPVDAQTFMGALVATGYMIPLVKGVEVVGGILLLTGRFVPLSLALLAPGIVNITLFHIFLAPAGLGMAGLLLALSLYLTWTYRDLYRPMLSSRVIPTETKRPDERYQFDHSASAHGQP